MSTGALFHGECPKQPALACRTGNIGASACPMAVFSDFYESHEPPALGDAHSLVLAHRHGHQKDQRSGYMLHRHFVDCHPGSRLENRERVVARWRCPVAFGVALDMLNRVMVMRSVLLQCVHVVIKMACNRDAFVCRRRLFRLL